MQFSSQWSNLIATGFKSCFAKGRALFSLLVLFTALGQLPAHAASPATAQLGLYPDVKVSPDGKHLAMAISNDGRRQLIVVEQDSFKAVGGVNFGKTQEVGNFFWATNERMVVEVMQRDPWDDKAKYYGELYAVDYNGKFGQMIFGYRAGEQQVGSKLRKKKAIFGWARIVDLMESDERNILISVAPMPGGSEMFTDERKRQTVNMDDVVQQHSTVHRLNIHDGRMGPSLGRSPVPNGRFITDNDGNLVLAFGDEKGDKQIYRLDGKEWTKLNINHPSPLTPLTVNLEKNVAYLMGQNGEEASLFAADLTSGELTPIHGQASMYMDDVAFTTDYRDVYAVKSAGQAGYHMLESDKDEAVLFSRLMDAFSNHQVDITSFSDDGQFWVIYANANDGSNQGYFLYNAESNELTQVM